MPKTHKFHAGICILLDLSIFLRIVTCTWHFGLNFVFYIWSGDAVLQFPVCIQVLPHLWPQSEDVKNIYSLFICENNNVLKYMK